MSTTNIWSLENRRRISYSARVLSSSVFKEKLLNSDSRILRADRILFFASEALKEFNFSASISIAQV